MSTAGPFGLPPILGGSAQNGAPVDVSVEDALILDGAGPYGIPPFGSHRAGSGGSTSLALLTDVDLSALADGDMLQYDAASGKWQNRSPALVGHYEVVMAGTGPPPDPVTDMPGTDWVYGWVPG